MNCIERKENLIQLYYLNQMSLAAIGRIYGVTKERVRQWMEREGLGRRKNGWKFKSPREPKFKSLTEYFAHAKKLGKEFKSSLLKFINKSKCEICGEKMKKLCIHHLHYPAYSINDIQILCYPCHVASHKHGNNNKTQAKICNEYLRGVSIGRLAIIYRTAESNIYYFLHKWGIKIRYQRTFGLSPEERNQKKKAYYSENRDRLLAYKREYYQLNKEEIKARRRQRYWNKKLALVN